MRILASDYKDYLGALRIAEYLYMHHPNNPYFERYYIRYLYSLHRYNRMEPIAKSIIAKVDSSKFGYEATSGRYAAFFLGQMYESRRLFEEAQTFYEKAIYYGNQNNSQETGYYLYALLNLGGIAARKGNKSEAKAYYKKVKKYAKRKSPSYKSAKKALNEL